MSIITREQAKDLRNAFQCWQQDYDPVEDRFYGGRFSDFASAQEAAARLRDKAHKEFANHGI